MGGKKKRYGPYQATKDKKSGKVEVVKGRKVMKGGVLSSRDRTILTTAFNNNNKIVDNNFIKPVEVNIRFYITAIFKKSIVFSNKNIAFLNISVKTLKHQPSL